MSIKKIQIEISEDQKNKMTVARGYLGINQNQFIQEAIIEKINKVITDENKKQNTSS